MLVKLIPKTNSAKSKLANLGELWMFHSWNKTVPTLNNQEGILFTLVSHKPWNGIWVGKQDKEFDFEIINMGEILNEN